MCDNIAITGSLFEEYLVLADYEATTDGEISAKAGDKVKVIRKEDSGREFSKQFASIVLVDYFACFIGWWLVAKDSNDRQAGFISSEYLKPYTGPKLLRQTLSNERSLGNSESTSALWMQYVVVEDYSTKDPRQLCLKRGETLVVIEKSEDGKRL